MNVIAFMNRGFTADGCYKTTFVLARRVWISYLTWLHKILDLFSPCSDNHTVVTFSKKNSDTFKEKDALKEKHKKQLTSELLDNGLDMV